MRIDIQLQKEIEKKVFQLCDTYQLVTANMNHYKDDN